MCSIVVGIWNTWSMSYPMKRAKSGLKLTDDSFLDHSEFPGLELTNPSQFQRGSLMHFGGKFVVYADSPSNIAKPSTEQCTGLQDDNKKRNEYLDWTDYFMANAVLASKRSKDPITQVGACIVNEDKRIIGLGYNGMPNRCHDDIMSWRKDSRFLVENKHFYVCHAEMNAIINANPAHLKGSTIYVTLFPCNECAKLIIQTGIKEVVYASYKGKKDKPENEASRRLLQTAHVSYRQYVPKEEHVLLNLKADN